MSNRFSKPFAAAVLGGLLVAAVACTSAQEPIKLLPPGGAQEEPAAQPTSYSADTPSMPVSRPLRIATTPNRRGSGASIRSRTSCR